MSGILQSFFASFVPAAGITPSKLYVWGLETDGVLGTGDTIRRSSPVQVGSLATWTSLASTTRASFGVRSDGRMFSWGSNDTWGQLGLNLSPVTTSNRSSPVQIGALTNWATVAAGSAPSISTRQNAHAIKTDGTLWAWGHNGYGQFGNNSTIERSSPVQVGVDTDWASVSTGGGTTFGIKSTGGLYAWGSNDQGQLGLNLPASPSYRRSSPVQVGALTTWATVTAGKMMGIAVRTDGTMWSWGVNYNGKLGHNNLAPKSSPVQIGALTSWYLASTFTISDHCLATRTDGTFWAWGNNYSGELGQNNRTSSYPFVVMNDRSSPVQVGSLTNWDQPSAGSSTSGAIKTDGTMWTWGNNNIGQLGQDTTIRRSSPVQVGALTSWTRLVMGNGWSLAGLK